MRGTNEQKGGSDGTTILHGHVLPEHQLRCELFRLPAKRLPPFGAVNAVQPNPLGFALVQDGDHVTIADAHHHAAEVGPEAGRGEATRL